MTATRPSAAEAHPPRRGPGARDRSQQYAMLAPALLALLALVVLPSALSVWFSLTDQRLMPRPVPTRFVGLRSYARVLGDPAFWQACRNTLAFALMVVPLQLGLSLAAALALDARLPVRRVFRSIAILPLLLPMTVVTAIWAALYRIPDGPFNAALQLLAGAGVQVDWLGSPATALPALVVLSAWATFPYQMLVYLAALQDIPRELHEAARVDGAGAWTRFRHVTWPGLRTVTGFLVIFTTIGALKLFTQVAILTRGGPDGATTTLVLYLFREGFQAQRIGQGSAVSVLFFLAVGALALGLGRALRDGGR